MTADSADSNTALPPAPDFTLRALHTGRVICRTRCAGRPLLLLFHDQDSVGVVRTLHEAVRARWPNPATLLFASVVNMQAIPPLLRGVAQTMMGLAFREAARQTPPGCDPTDYVIILPDATGKVCFALGIHDGGKTPTALLIDGGWRLCGRFSGAELAPQTMAALEAMLAPALHPAA